MGTITWTEADLQYLRERYPVGDQPADIAAHLGKTPEAVKGKATVLGLRRLKPKMKWAPVHDRYLRMYYPRGDVKAMAARLGTTLLSVYQHARVIGVLRDPEMVLQTNRALGKALAAKDAGKRFVKGQVSPNKGRKQVEYMSVEKIERTKATRFQKGRPSINLKPIGYERVSKDGYIEVKVRNAENSKDNFELKQRLVWEEHNGPIPEGSIVEFIDGNKQNCDISNLRCITRKENVIRNGLSDNGIIKRRMKVRDPEMVEIIKNEYPHLVELKRTEVIVKSKLNEHSRKSRKV
jgi:hypothetical protein